MFLQTRSETLRASFRWRKNKKTKKEDTNQEIEGDEEMVEVMVPTPAAAAMPAIASTKADAAASLEIVTKKPHTKIFCCMS